MVVLDLIDVPGTTLTRVPRSTWLRLQRVVEGTEVALLLMAVAPIARSAGGLSIATGAAAGARPGVPVVRGAEDIAAWPAAVGEAHEHERTSVRWKGSHDRTRRLAGLGTRLRATSPRGYVGELPLAIG